MTDATTELLYNVLQLALAVATALVAYIIYEYKRDSK